MWLFIASLAMLFAATLVGFLVIRLGTAEAWPELPPLPAGLRLSTFVLIASSATLWAAAFVARRRTSGVGLAMLATLVLGVVFLVVQTVCWIEWLAPVADAWPESGEARFALTSFYVTTGLHALHVIGGLIPMAVVTGRALRGQYGPESHDGVDQIGRYWHFLDAVWVVLYVSLLFGV